jgi:pilus assembly protein CpaF
MNIDIQQKINKIFNRQKDNYSYNWKEDFKHETKETLQRIDHELNNLGPLTSLLSRPEVTEVLVNSFDQIFFEAHGVLSPSHDLFYSQQTYYAALERLSQNCGTYLNREKPFIESHWNNLRISLVFSEISRGTTLLSLRKQPESAWTLQKLLQSDFLNRDELALIQQIFKSRKNFLVVGGTGSGKTSFLQALLQQMPENERAIIIEDTQELRPPNAVSTYLLTRQDPSGAVSDVSMTDLLKRALRLRPDRLIVGEIRGAEATALLLALSSGHDGSLGSLHAKSAPEALLRLEMLVQMGAPQWSLQSVRQLIAMTLQYVLVLEKCGRKRFLKGIYKINSLEETGFTLTPLDQGETSLIV